MIRIGLAVLTLVFLLAAATAVRSSEPGTPYCFGVGCPCGNDDPNAGCVNSTGQGALLTGSGTTSVAADDIAFHATQLPTTSVTLLVMGSDQRVLSFYDGLLCIGGDIRRFRTHLNSGHLGAVTFTGIIATYAEHGTVIEAGQTWHYQIWSRDSGPPQSPCGKKANLTNAYTVSYTP